MPKPIYKIPSMVEIEATPWNGFKVASTFSGCGGSCLGYRIAGYKVIYANEFIESARQTYKANHPNSFLDPRDIRKITADDILEKINLKKGELHLVLLFLSVVNVRLVGVKKKNIARQPKGLMIYSLNMLVFLMNYNLKYL